MKTIRNAVADCRPLLVLTLAGLGWAPGAAADDPQTQVNDARRPLPQPAFRADDFIDSIGLAASPFIGVHTEGPFAGAGTHYEPEVFLDLGVRYYRTGLYHALVEEDTPDRRQQAWREHGVRPLMLIDPHKTKTPEAVFEHLGSYDPRSIWAIEGPNEVNNKFPPQELNQRYAGLIDEAAGAAFTRDIATALAGSEAWADLPVVNYTAIFTDYDLARPLDVFDFNNMHSYQGHGVPSSSLLMNITRANHILPDGATIKPFVPTEAGYNVEQDRTNQQGWTGSRRAQARNVPMLLAEYFAHGIPKTFLFALHNADGYGLMESDSKTLRPSYHALRSMIAELSDAAWNADSLKWERPGFRPRALPFVFEGDAPSSVHTLTLQRSDGAYQLLIWNESPNYDPQHGDLDPAPTPVTLRFARPVGARAEVLTQNEQGTYDRQTADTSEGGRVLRLSVPTSVMIVRLTPPAVEDAERPAPAARVTGEADEAGVTLRWRPSAETAGDRAGWFVYRNGRHVATLPPDQTELADATAWVRPGLGYRYAVQAFDTAGNTSEAVEAVVVTPAARPDLVIDRIEPVAGGNGLQPGEPVRFAAVMRNIGAGRTPHHVPIGVAFRIDGRVVGWITDDRPLAPGESRRVVSNGGGRHGNGTWTATDGVHLLAAEVDDINRIAGETNETNNRIDRSLRIGRASPGVLEVESKPAPFDINLTEEGVLDWAHWGLRSAEAVHGKTGADLIGRLTHKGRGHLGSTAGHPSRFTWTDGEPTASVRGVHDALWLNGVDHTYSFAVDADPSQLRELRVYVSGIEGARGRFEARLSDDSAPAVVSETWDGNRTRKTWAGAPGGFNAVYTVRFRPHETGARLVVTWRLAAEPTSWRGQARLAAATLRALDKAD